MLCIKILSLLNTVTVQTVTYYTGRDGTRKKSEIRDLDLILDSVVETVADAR